MSDENSNSNESTPISSEQELNVPEPPPPADIGGSDISTHSANLNKNRRFITDNNHHKK